MPLSVEIVMFVTWLVAVVMVLYGKDRLQILLGTLMCAYIGMWNFNTYTEMQVGEWIIFTFVISVLGVARMVRYK